MNLLTIITLALAALSLLTFLWLVMRAFSRGVKWGLGVLLLSPIGAAVFGMKHWNAEKKPVVAYLMSTLGGVSLALYLFSSWGGWEVLRTKAQVEAGLRNGNLSVHSAEAFMQANTEFVENSGIDISDGLTTARVQQRLELEAAREAELEAARVAEEERESLNARQINKKVKPKEQRYRLLYRTIDIDDAPKYVGATVKVTRKNSQEKEYRLADANGKRLRLTQRSSSGSYSFSFHNNDIEKLRVLIKQPY